MSNDTLPTIEDFIPYYPIINHSSTKFNLYDDNPKSSDYDLFNKKKEFNELQLSFTNEKKPEKAGLLLKQQVYASRFVSPFTMNDGILLFWGLGSGKTCAAIAIAEAAIKANKEANGAPHVKILVITKNESIKTNFMHELVYQCTDNVYIPKLYNQLTDKQKNFKTNRLIAKNYEFETFYSIALAIDNRSDDQVVREFSDKIICIDEAHNLRLYDVDKEDQLETRETRRIENMSRVGKKKVNVYESVHRMLHLVKNRKVILLTATPMRDSCEEFATSMNLILPLSNQIEVGSEFVKKYFDKDLNLRNEDDLKEKIRGRISYLRGGSTDVNVKYSGAIPAGFKHFVIQTETMSAFQKKVYIEAFNKDKKLTQESPATPVSESKSSTIQQRTPSSLSALVKIDKDKSRGGLYTNSQQASLMIFPDGTYGNEGFKKYIKGSGKGYYLEASKFFRGENKDEALSLDDKQSFIDNLSSIYGSAIRNIRLNSTQNTFVYSKLVSGSGAIAFSCLLSLMGLKRWNVNDSPSKDVRRYVIITSLTTSKSFTDAAIQTFNSPENRNGDIIQVIIGSQLIGEGISLKNVRQIHVFTPHWNNSETEQAIGRGIRAFSHRDLPPSERNVTVRKYSSVFQDAKDSLNRCIDLIRYKISEDKDYQIKKIEQLAKTTAVDCVLNKKANLVVGKEDGSRDCNYGACNYTCDFVSSQEIPREEDLITDTYNLFYAANKIDGVVEKLKSLFQRKFFYFFFEIKDSFESDKQITQIILLRALSGIIESSMKIYNRYGIECYLRENNDVYFLVDDISLTSENYFSYYTQFPCLIPETSFVEVVRQAQIESIPMRLEKISTAIDSDKKDSQKTKIVELQLDTLPDLAQELFIETSLNYGDDEIKRIVREKYRSYLRDNGDQIISTFSSKYQKTSRCGVKSSGGDYLWEDCEGDLGFNNSEEERRKNLMERAGKLGVYGLIRDGIFLLKKIDRVQDKDNFDKRMVYKGIGCISIHLPQILDYVFSLNVPPPVKKGENVVIDKKQLSEKIKSVFGRDFARKNVQFAYFKKSMLNPSYVEALSDKELYRLQYFLSSVTKPKLCKILEKWFEDNDLVDFD